MTYELLIYVVAYGWDDTMTFIALARGDLIH